MKQSELNEMTVDEQNIWADERRARIRGSRKRAFEVRRERDQDVARLDKLDALAKRVSCGWTIQNDRPRVPFLKHWSQEPLYATIREAIDAMPEIEEES